MRRLARIGTVAAIGTGLGLMGCAGNPSGRTMPGDDATGETVRSSSSTNKRPDTSSQTKRDAGAPLDLVTTQAEPVKGNDAWCGTMQLCWNNIIDKELGGNPVVFSDDAYNTEEVAHLNAKLFNTGDVSDDHYYTYAGDMTSKAKEEIKQAISEKFGQDSDILDSFTGWDQGGQFLYAMLYRQFSFVAPFAISDGSDLFGSTSNENKAEGVAYFEADSDEQRSQVTPLYYEDYAHHAVRLETADGDELVLVSSPQGSTLDEIWQNAMERAANAESNAIKPLDKKETFRCPNLDINLLHDSYAWVGPKFNNGWYITQAMQTLKLHLDNEGGEVKSEAGIAMTKSADMDMDEKPARSFVYNDTFALFVRDGNAGNDAYPYVGVLVSDITQFQSGAEKV